jgi:6-phosphogluconolactonase
VPLSEFTDRADLMRAAAERVTSLAEHAIATRGEFAWALAGGKTPEELYRLLAGAPHAARIDWTRVHFFWSDERCVPAAHPDSNYRMARESLLDRVRPPEAHVHRMQGELPPLLEASRYERELAAVVPAAVVPADRAQSSPDSRPPRLDLILLGMGADGHTASLFPGAAAVSERQRWVTATRIEGREVARLTFTLPLINAAAAVLFLVAGADKAPALARVMAREPQPTPGAPSEALPAQLVRPATGELEWLVDAQAASLL